MNNLRYRMWATPVPDRPGAYTYTLEFGGSRGTWTQQFPNPDRLEGFWEGLFVGAKIDLPARETAEVPQEADHPENVRIMQLVDFRAACMRMIERPGEHPYPGGLLEETLRMAQHIRGAP